MMAELVQLIGLLAILRFTIELHRNDHKQEIGNKISSSDPASNSAGFSSTLDSTSLKSVTYGVRVFTNTVEPPWATISLKRAPNQNPDWFLRQSKLVKLPASDHLSLTSRAVAYGRFHCMLLNSYSAELILGYFWCEFEELARLQCNRFLFLTLPLSSPLILF